jgi:hypothetical protein
MLNWVYIICVRKNWVYIIGYMEAVAYQIPFQIM